MHPSRWIAGSTFVCRYAAIVILLAAGTVAADGEEAATWRGEREDKAKVVRIAVCQIFCIDGDVEGNLRRIEYAVEDAAAQKADLATFPESAVLGWVNPEARNLADSIPGPVTERLGTLARRHHLMICVGVDEKDGGKVYDSAVLIGADGTLLLKQRKVDNLAEQKLVDPPYADGRPEDVKIVETPLGRIGIAICADSYNEELVRGMSRFLPDLLLVPVGWAAEKERWPQYGQVLAGIVRRAAEWAGCPAVGTDCVGMITHGPWAGRIYGGQSVVADCRGMTLGLLRDRDAEVRVLDVPVGRRCQGE